MESELEALPPGSRVAVVTLLGSLAPVTRAHIMMFDEAKSLLLDAGRLRVRSSVEHGLQTREYGY